MLRTVWFSKEIQLGTMIDARVKAVAGTLLADCGAHEPSLQCDRALTSKKGYQSSAKNNRPRQDSGVIMPSTSGHKIKACHPPLALIDGLL